MSPLTGGAVNTITTVSATPPSTANLEQTPQNALVQQTDTKLLTFIKRVCVCVCVCVRRVCVCVCARARARACVRAYVNAFVMCISFFFVFACVGRTRLHAGHKSAWYDVALASYHTHQLSLQHMVRQSANQALSLHRTCSKRPLLPFPCPAISRFHSRRSHVAQTRNTDTHRFLSHTDRATQSTGKDAQEYDDLGAGKRNWLRMLHVEKKSASARHRMAEGQQVRSSAGRQAR